VELTKKLQAGHTLLPVALQPGDSVGVEIFGELVAAEVAEDVQYDPGNERVRS
jgi:glycine cleavage system aminomethyltransferase T